jgi:transcriptional regulator with XRE-family HTH domain
MDGKNTKLGKYLKSLRQAHALSLRAVEKETGISNGMLSQLESGKVKQPSPIFLHKLAKFYGVPYEGLMEKAGYPVPEPIDSSPSQMKGPFHRLGQLTGEEEEALFEYLTFIRSRSNRGRGKQ